MIIDQLSYSDTGSQVGTDSFLINFDRLFEDFVAKILKEIPDKKEFSTWASKRKLADVYDSAGNSEEREYQPDIVYRFIAEDEKYDYNLLHMLFWMLKTRRTGSLKTQIFIKC